jgi:polar amino acid transport system substrate-binding protein
VKWRDFNPLALDAGLSRFLANRSLAKWGVRTFLNGLTRTLLLVIAFELLTSAAAQPGSTRDLKTIVDQGVLRVSVTRFDLPAFHWRTGDGTLAGPEIELGRQIAGALGVRVAFIEDPASFDAVVDTVANGQADIGISKLSQTYYRLMRVRFSEPYVTLRHALLYERATIAARSKGRPPEEALRQFLGRIGAIRGSAYVDFGRRNFPSAEVVEMATWNETVEELSSRRVNAIYRDEFEVRRVLKNRPALNVHFGAAIITDQKAFLSVAICESCVRLQEFINYHLIQTQGAFTLEKLLASDLRNK